MTRSEIVMSCFLSLFLGLGLGYTWRLHHEQRKFEQYSNSYDEVDEVLQTKHTIHWGPYKIMPLKNGGVMVTINH